ncbi:NAD(P)-dependent dehydrogenase (short-subunit alcohol dehydrogenase family) [Microbacterium ginsengiterrae]|uniref:NAD(P)-dependent dehydrogenase (Short-subunit alcohol dehydrogenase family) n=1 Tax=Microbacterium ginsengiterrae TaxID=546115 RepID=A0A7W9CC58_9MICO|nr:short chain dehydrogenase [Microbacterium ginsengiterrae]MBB5742818.1 NAD(P)-dependent dehydrogenase (short-subunit alcohol dehydrogenase family) [Microbacterium ginsengiterrae]
MRILVIGATGKIGGIVASTFESRGHEVLRASRSSEWSVDLTDPASVLALFERVGQVDAVVMAAGSVPFAHLTELTRDDYLAAFTSKALPQMDTARVALDHVTDGGSITLTTGVLAREPIATGAAAAAANGAVESFVITAAAEAPRGIRINAVSPNVLQNSPTHHALFAGQRPVQDEEIGRVYTLAVEGLVRGRILTA